MNPRYLEDASGFRGHAERLIIPADEAGVAAALREAFASSIPVTVAGAGTGVTGARVPLGGWVVSLEKLNRIEIGSGSAVAGSGALLSDVYAAAYRTGQFYPPDPTENSACIGGTIATNASGSRSFRYGATRRWVESLRVIMPDGCIRQYARGDRIDFEVPAIPLPAVTKNTAGYPLQPGMDWVDLFIGSEGTLAVVAEARLRLLPLPKAVLGGVVFFASDDAAIDAVEFWRGTVPVRMLEYLDGCSLDLLRARFAEIPPEAGAALLIEQEIVSEEDSEVDRWLDRLEVAGALADASWFALSASDRERFRRFRHAVPELVNETVRRNGTLKMSTDHAVPLARNREMLAYYRVRLQKEFPGRYVIFGHIGDAHLHANILPSPEQAQRASELLAEFAQQAVAWGGTVSAEHGLGKRKAYLLSLQYGPGHIEEMRAVKRRLDPHNILGRGTLFSK